jgi:formylmethanofuran dehydrogenase subunit E
MIAVSQTKGVPGDNQTSPSVICESCGDAVVSEQVSYDSDRLKIVCGDCRGEHRQGREKRD